MEIIFNLDNFQGPLDLLLHLIERKKLNIQEVNILRLIDEYLEIVQKEKKENLEIKMEFILIATELLEIKALEVIKSQLKEEKEKELKQRLEDYKNIKIISEEIGKLQKEFNIGYTKEEGRKITRKPSKEFKLDTLKQLDLFNEYKKFVEKKQDEVMTLELNKEYSLEEETKKIYLKILTGKTNLGEIFSMAENRNHLIYIFLSILEMYKDGLIEIDSQLNIGRNG